MAKRACLDENRRFEYNLRVSIERLLMNTYDNLCTRTSYRAAPAIKSYIDKRRQMSRAGIPEEDAKRYDARFLGLPWEISGLEIPEIEGY